MASAASKYFPFDVLTLPVVVAALGYFIDVYDIWIFGANRIASLTDIGVPADRLFDTGVFLLNMQMGGLFLGGLFFGLLGDRFGRTKMMFASILTYSLATLANAFVQDVGSYAAMRFIAGFGLAGELGLAVTLISEILPRERRGYGTGIIVGFGIFGALAAAVFAHIFPWRVSFIIGGVAGLILLYFRMKVAESHLFEAVEAYKRRGQLKLLFSSRERIVKFFYCVCLMMPIWCVAGVLVTFAPEIVGQRYGVVIAAATLMVYFNLFLALSDFASAWISQYVKQRRGVLLAFTAFGLAMTTFLLVSPVPLNIPAIILVYIGIACGAGCWVLGATVAAESFGTNLRATVATTVPNFSRAGTIPMTLAVLALKDHMDLNHAALCVAAVVFALALWAAYRLPETFGKNLDYLESNPERHP